MTKEQEKIQARSAIEESTESKKKTILRLEYELQSAEGVVEYLNLK